MARNNMKLLCILFLAAWYTLAALTSLWLGWQYGRIRAGHRHARKLNLLVRDVNPGLDAKGKL